MDFFQAQDRARRRTVKLVLLFSAAVLSLIVLTNLLVGIAIAWSSNYPYTTNVSGAVLQTPREHWWWISTLVLIVVGGACLYKYLALGGGGRAIAESLGGRRLVPDTADLAEKRLLNIVEELALAAGIPVPPVYLLPEQSINAFAAGATTDDAVIGVTEGALQSLNRDELQGVIGHEFSHVLNGDMGLNLRLIAVLHGILFIGLVGYMLLRSIRLGRRNSNAMPVVALGAGLVAVGFIGTFFGNLIKAAVSRQREYLADASAVQFTRNPLGIAGALKKIGGATEGSRLAVAQAGEYSHMFFGQAVKPFLAGLTATHPPLDRRIRAIEPGWDGRFPKTQAHQAMAAPAGAMGFANAGPDNGGGTVAPSVAGVSPKGGATADGAVAEYGQLNADGLNAARALMESLEPALIDAAHDGFSASALIYALLISHEADVQRQQLARFESLADRSLATTVTELYRHAAPLSAPQRLALVSLAIPALKGVSKEQYSTLLHHTIALIRADARISLFEWVLHRLLVKELKPEFERVSPPRVKYRKLGAVHTHINELVSALARAGSSEHDQIRAHEAGMRSLDLDSALITENDPNFQRLSRALNELRALHPLAKPRLLKACAETVLADEFVSDRQWTLLQGISATLDCPLPPHLAATPHAGGGR